MRDLDNHMLRGDWWASSGYRQERAKCHHCGNDAECDDLCVPCEVARLTAEPEEFDSFYPTGGAWDSVRARMVTK